MQKMLGIKIPSRPMGVQETVTIVDPAAETGSGGGGDFNLVRAVMDHAPRKIIALGKRKEEIIREIAAIDAEVKTLNALLAVVNPKEV